MSAILHTAGPVTSNVSFSRRAPNSLRSIPKEQFSAAANMLQASDLCTLVTMGFCGQFGGGRGTNVFVKRPPADVVAAIEANSDIISFEKYARRCNQQIPSCITAKIREELITLGLLTPEQRSTSSGGKRFCRGTSLIRDIMSAILQTAGPVTSTVSFSRRGPMSLRTIPKEQFQAAANMLQAAHLGTMILVSPGSRGSVLFVKTPPEEAGEAVAANADIINMEKYAARYYQQIPTCVSMKTREHLISIGLLKHEQACIGINVPNYLSPS